MFTGENKEIALLENIVHVPPMLIPDLDILTIEIPDSFTHLDVEELTENWKDYPAPTILSEIGERWIHEWGTLALKVPSCIIHTSHNYILNCRHPEYQNKVKILEHKSFHFDSRLVRYDS